MDVFKITFKSGASLSPLTVHRMQIYSNIPSGNSLFCHFCTKRAPTSRLSNTDNSTKDTCNENLFLFSKRCAPCCRGTECVYPIQSEAGPPPKGEPDSHRVSLCGPAVHCRETWAVNKQLITWRNAVHWLGVKPTERELPETYLGEKECVVPHTWQQIVWSESLLITMSLLLPGCWRVRYGHVSMVIKHISPEGKTQNGVAINYVNCNHMVSHAALEWVLTPIKTK